MTGEAKLREALDAEINRLDGELSLADHEEPGNFQRRSEHILKAFERVLASALEAVRREALLEAAHTICQHCAEGTLKVEIVNGVAKHRVAGGRTYEHCYAHAIRALASRAAIAPGEGQSHE
jgi:hypothetical protein